VPVVNRGWVGSDRTRRFRLRHWEYDGSRIDGWDYDIGAALVREASADDESELLVALRAWQLRPDELAYPWDTDDPR